MTTSAGAVCYSADFYPFGGERVFTDSCAQNYKFTGKERDAETGNDNFGARYYTSSFGRFEIEQIPDSTRGRLSYWDSRRAGWSLFRARTRNP